MKIQYLYIIVVGILLGACSDFLEENSQDLMIPKSVKNYKEFLYGEGLNNKVVLCEYLDVMTDDAEEIINTNRPAATSTDTRKFWSYYTWQEYPEMQMDNSLLEDNAWGEYYHRILIANIVLDHLNDMIGTYAEKMDIAGEAYFLRAWSYFMLANLYGKPYIDEAQTAKDFCVPINRAIDIEEKPLSRSSIKEVYDLMEADIKSSIASFKSAMVEKTIFRPNLPTSYLLASRIALFRKSYDDAIAYADSVLLSTKATLFDMTEDYTIPRFLNSGNCEILFSYGEAPSGGLAAFQYASSRRAAFIPSTGLMKLYVENDQRKASKLFFATEGKKPMKYYGSTSDNMYPHAFRLAEVYLNRAEAYAAKGMTAEALREVNALREKRIPENYEVTAATAADAFALVKDERRMEFCFEAFRWFDLRRWDRPKIVHRFSSAENPSNYIEYVLQQDDPAYTLPIPQKEREMNLSIENINRPQREK